MASETVLVVGSTGLVGRAAVRALVKRGHTVRALVRRPDAAKEFQGPGLSAVVGDLAGGGDWSQAMDGVTAVVDATQVRIPGRLTVRKARRGAEERGRMVAFLLSKVRAQPTSVRSYVALSGLEDYAPTGDAWFDESTPPASEVLGYSHLSVRSRALLAEARREWGLPLVMLRMGLIYGPSGWFPEFADRIRRGRGVLVGSGTNYSSFVSSVDVGEAIRAAVETAPRGEEFLISDDEPMAQAGWQAILAANLGRPAVRRRVPFWLASLTAGRVNAETFTSSRRARNQRAKDRLGLSLTYPTVRPGFPWALAEAPVVTPK
ncbi:MAG TPA: NAD-dependent epimerase/dehydratase family protein [Thermoplasmata archaeon]|nr:NAD-dependent epimerase/dehydratase family protein [Thermoplasmata archaeon]